MRYRDLFFHSRNATPDSAFRKKFLGARPFDTLHTNRRSWHAKMGDKNPFRFAVAKFPLSDLLATNPQSLRFIWLCLTRHLVNYKAKRLSLPSIER